jgi:hypothetical protein
VFKEHDSVRLKRQVKGIPQGTLGVIVLIVPEISGEVMVEFPGWNEGEGEFPAIEVNIDDLELATN